MLTDEEIQFSHLCSQLPGGDPERFVAWALDYASACLNWPSGFGTAWDRQGFGMLRTRVGDAVRLNVWHPDLAVANASDIHTHPWNFLSVIVCGELTNVSYLPSVVCDEAKCNFDAYLIKPGPGGGLLGEAQPIALEVVDVQKLRKGEYYFQLADEIHKTITTPGTVTVNYRVRRPDDEATVFVPIGTPWVSAEPFPASLDTVTKYTAIAQRLMRDED